MAKEALSNSVSISELRHMREVEGLTNKEIAKRLDVAPSTISRYLGPQDPEILKRIRRKSGGQHVEQSTIDEILRLYDEGRSINGIAEKLGLGWNTVKADPQDKGPNWKKKKELDAIPVEPIKVEPIAHAEKSVANEEPVVPEVPVQEGEISMLRIISSRQSIRMQGAECQYEVELGAGTDSVTIINSDKQEVAVLDADGLSGLIGELSQILCKMKEAAAA